MMEILGELNHGVDEIIASFIIDENGGVEAQEGPELMAGPIDMVSKTLFHFTNVVQSTKPINKLTFESERAKLISIPFDGLILVVLAEKNINQPLFKLMSNMVISKIRESPRSTPGSPPTKASVPATIEPIESRPVYDLLDESVLEGAQASFTLIDRYGKVIDSKKSIPLDNFEPGDTVEFNIVKRVRQKINVARYKVKETPSFDVNKICDLYDQLFGVVGRRLARIVGPKSAVYFKVGANSIEKNYPKLFEDLSFNVHGKPDMSTLRDRAKKISNKDELIEALDELLLCMFDTVKKIIGSKQEQKAFRALDETLESIKKTEGGEPEQKALDSVQKIKIERFGIL
jgi:hypothetical protein